MKKILEKQKGFSLIELTITIGIIGVLGMGLWSAWVIGLQVTTEKRAEVTATAIANEQIERLKTLPYETLGTVGGIPTGPLPRETTMMRNGITYTVQTAVFYIDDPFDNTAPQDAIPTDYKRIRVTVLWDGKFGVSPVVLMTDAAPNGLETNTGGGTLLLRVADAEKAPIPDATVTIKNTAAVPPIDTVLTTNANGQLMIPGAPASQEGYDITVTKTGYSSDGTIRAAVGVNPSPARPPLSVTDGQTTEAGFFIDRLATLTITTVDNRGSQGWWRSNWQYRMNVTLTNNGSADAGGGSPVRIDLNHAALVQAGKSLANGEDIRVVFFNGTYFEDLDRIATNPWNTGTTTLWFATKRPIARNEEDENYALYYGNREASTPPASPSRVFPPPIGADTIGLWYFDDGKGATIARDTSGNGHDGALQNLDPQTAWVQGALGSAILLNTNAENTQYVRVAPTPTLQNIQFFTVEAWVKPKSLYGNHIIASKATNNKQQGKFHFYTYWKSVCLFVWKDVNPYDGEGCGAGLTENVWQHVAATFDGRFIRTYVNGALVGTAEKPGNLVQTENIELTIGKYAVKNWEFFQGTIDGVALHRSARTDFSYGKPTTIALELSTERNYLKPNAIPNVTLTVTGAKIVGNDDAGKPISKFTTTKTTDAAGTLTLPHLEWDAYTIRLNGAATGYDIRATMPLLPVSVVPGNATTQRLTLASHRTDTLLVTVRNKQTPLDGASVRVTATGYDKTIVTGEEGQSFFSPLTADTTYDIIVTKPEFTTATTSMNVHGQTYEDIPLAPL